MKTVSGEENPREIYAGYEKMAEVVLPHAIYSFPRLFTGQKNRNLYFLTSLLEGFWNNCKIKEVK